MRASYQNRHSKNSICSWMKNKLLSFEEGFKFLGVVPFVRSMIMVPFDRPKKERKILFYPDSLNIDDYLMKKRKTGQSWLTFI